MTTKLNREWVKSAAIVFLAVMLVLTFFSNTIMNRTLPEVATQGVMSGSITAKVRGTGTVTANGLHEVKADAVREIRTVLIKTGQEVNAGDALFILGKGNSDELETAQENLESLQMSYNTTALGYETFNPDSQAKKEANAAVAAAQAEIDRLEKQANSTQIKDKQEKIEAAEKELFDAKEAFNTAREAYEKDPVAEGLLKILGEKQTALDEKKAELEKAKEALADAQAARLALPETADDEEKGKYKTAVEDAEGDVDDATLAVTSAETEVTTATNAVNTTPTKVDLDKAEAAVAAAQKKLDALNDTFSPYIDALAAAKAKLVEAQNALKRLEEQEAQESASAAKANSTTYYQLQSLASQIERARAKVLELSGEEGKQITANVSGTIQSVDCTAGNTVEKDALLCTIEVPDMGYGVSFTVTSEQARRLRVGDTASVSNYYWGKEIIATLTSIKTDPKSPQANKILSFELDGDVDAGSELTISVGQKSATYDTVIPNSSIRSDTNGSFVLKIEAKSSPLGNRYIARRVSVEVLAADDLNSAVTGDLSNGDYVITTSNNPVANGDQVKMADS